MSTTTGSPWTDEDLQRACAALDPYAFDATIALRKREAHQSIAQTRARAVLDALAPRVAELQRAAKAEALALAEDAVRLGEDHGLDECPDCGDDFTAIRDEVRGA